jgi:hypothetical protein
MGGDVYGHGCVLLKRAHVVTSLLCVVVIEKPHKKTETYSSVDTKVNGRKPLPYKKAGELFIPPNLHPLTLIGKRTYIYSHLMKNKHKSE